jgi:hypothetical protein
MISLKKKFKKTKPKEIIKKKNNLLFNSFFLEKNKKLKKLNIFYFFRISFFNFTTIKKKKIFKKILNLMSNLIVSIKWNNYFICKKKIFRPFLFLRFSKQKTLNRFFKNFFFFLNFYPNSDKNLNFTNSKIFKLRKEYFEFPSFFFQKEKYLKITFGKIKKNFSLNI